MLGWNGAWDGNPTLRKIALHFGAQGRRLPHLFQKYVGPGTSAFRYAVRSAVRGKRRAPSRSLLSFPVESPLPLAAFPPPASQPKLAPSL